MGCFQPGDLVRYVGDTFRKQLEDVCCVVSSEKKDVAPDDSIFGIEQWSYGIQRVNNPEDTIFYVGARSIVPWGKTPHWDEEQV